MIAGIASRFRRRKRSAPPEAMTGKTTKRKRAGISGQSARMPIQRKRPRAITTETAHDAGLEETNRVDNSISDQERAALQVSELEATARKNGPKRWNAAIDPSSDEFKAKHREFGTALRDPTKTTAEILNSSFTAHEKAMLTPVDRRGNPALYRIQADNRIRYQNLLKSVRFKAWAARADLAFKFTLTYYGLPVAPMIIGSEQVFSDWEDGSDEGEDLLQSGRPLGGHLRFLNSYGVRHFGQSSLRAPDATYENYYTFEGLHPVNSRVFNFPSGPSLGDTLSLRGGGSDDNDMDIDDNWSGAGFYHDDVLGIESDLGSETDSTSAEPTSTAICLRGGAGAVVPDTQPTKPDSLQESSRKAATERMTALYGFQGVVYFDHQDVSSFADAFDRLLGVGARGNINIKLAAFDRNVDYYGPEPSPSQVEVEMGPQDDATMFGAMLKWAAPYITDPDSKYALFVCPEPASVPKTFAPDAFSEGSVMFLRSKDSKVDDTAYLRMPPNAHHLKLWHENIYSPWIQAAARLLFPGRIPGNPGRPEVPDVYIGHRPGPEGTLAYGGLSLPPLEFESLVAAWNKKRSIQFLRSIDGSKIRQTGLTMYIPGYSLSVDEDTWSIPYGDIGGLESAIELRIKRALHPAAFAAVTHIDVWWPGGRMYVPGDAGKYSFAMSHNKDSVTGNRPVRPLVDALRRDLGDSRGRGQVQREPPFLVVSPRFRGPTGYTVFSATDARSTFRLDDGMTLEQFIFSLTATAPRTPRGRPFDLSEVSISLSHASCDWDAPPESRVRVGLAKPISGSAAFGSQETASATPMRDPERLSFFISEATTEDEFRVIVSKITSPYLIYEFVYYDAEPEIDVKRQPWGYYDIYESDALYKQGKQRPKEVRHGTYSIPKPEISHEAATVPPTDKRKEVHFEEAPVETGVNVTQAKPSGGVHPNFYGLRPAPQGQPLSDMEKAKHMRQLTWDRAPSVHTHMTVPINAPPVEAILRTGSDSVPILSLGVLTPTEQQKMRMDYYNLRNIVLQRSQKCPYYGCNRVFKVSESDKIQRHLSDIHAADKCNFCDTLLYKHWSELQRREHFYREHYHNFAHGDLRRQNNKIIIPFDGHVNQERESLWNFCARCGRDHRELDVKADRANHDNICYPGALDSRDRWISCSHCGRWIGDLKIHTHKCRLGVDTKEQPYCSKCSLPLGVFTSDYRSAHLNSCRGRNNIEDQFCPWCGIDLSGSKTLKLGHLRVCGRRPDENAEGPVDFESGKPWPAPAESRKGAGPKLAGTRKDSVTAVYATGVGKEVAALKADNAQPKKNQADQIDKVKKAGEGGLPIEVDAPKDRVSNPTKVPTSVTPQPPRKTSPRAPATISSSDPAKPDKGRTPALPVLNPTVPRSRKRKSPASSRPSDAYLPPVMEEGYDDKGGESAETSTADEELGRKRAAKKAKRTGEPDSEFRPEGTPPADKEDDRAFEALVEKSKELEKESGELEKESWELEKEPGEVEKDIDDLKKKST